LEIDISLVLNLHREAKYVVRTLMALREAVSFASVYGIVTELVIVLDRPDQATRDALQEVDFDVFCQYKILEINIGSLGPARNEGIQHAAGKYVRLCDGDDLVSFNILKAMFFEAERDNCKRIYIPEWLFAFGAEYHKVKYRYSNQVTPFALFDSHPFVSQIFVNRSIFAETQFLDLRVAPGYAYEDWHFACEAIAKGYDFGTTKDTVLFYRKRPGSLLTQANSTSVRQIPPSTLFNPDVFVDLTARYCAPLDCELRPKDSDEREFLDTSVCQYLLSAANQIDPAVDPDKIKVSARLYPVSEGNLSTGKFYREVCQSIVGRRFTDIFIVPSFGKGGAELYLINVISGLLETKIDASILVIVGDNHPDNAWLSRLSANVKCINLASAVTRIDDSNVDLITLKLIQSIGVEARLHIRDSSFGHRFLARFGRVLKSNTRIYYCFSQASRTTGHLTFTEPWRFQFIDNNFENIDVIVTDNRALVDFDRRRIGISPSKWRVIPPFCQPTIERVLVARRNRQASNKILWASRVASEKRPELIAAVAKILKERRAGMSIEVRGDLTPAYEFSTIDGPVRYLGAYDKFSDFSHEEYLCLMYTSLQDGLPNVLLESAAAGIPIVAPDVGGISQFVKGDVNGLLLPNISDNGQMAEVYVNAIMRLHGDAGLRVRLALAAYDRVESGHSARVYRQKLMEIFGSAA
jgi:glycosyltransferase involved in cell wall biosynthesis